MAFKTGSGATLKTAITDTRIIQGNLTGRSGRVQEVINSPSVGSRRYDLYLETGNIFSVNPYYPGIDTNSGGYVNFLFRNPASTMPNKFLEFYLIWHNYKDDANDATSTWYPSIRSSSGEVRFENQQLTLNNSNAGLRDGMTQIFKFTTITSGYGSGILNQPPSWYGSIYMKNCPPNVFPDY